MFQIDYCEYNRTNVDYDRIYRPGPGRRRLPSAPLKDADEVPFEGKLEISGENAFLLYAPGMSGLPGGAEIPEQLCSFFYGSSVCRRIWIPTSILFIRKISWNWTNTSA